MARVLLLLPTTSYRGGDFLRAAAKLGVEVAVASEEASAVERLNPSGLLTLDFRDARASAERIAEASRLTPFAAVLGVDEETSAVAARASARLGLPHNPPEAAARAANKALMRERLNAAGVPSPRHRVRRIDEDPAAAARETAFPCVLKPTILSGSRGVIRADDPEQFGDAWKRLGRILAEPDVSRRAGSSEVLVEDFVPGAEVALEGLLDRGTLRTLAIFDKPDPLDGPFFEETIYVTPSRLPGPAQEAVASVSARAAAALGLTEGPLHAELRWDGRRATVIEVAARSIGGLCARTLRFGIGMTLEELILRHALGLGSDDAPRQPGAAGVMMIPIPREGVYEGVEGRDAARGVEGIEEVVITAHPGQRLVPLPEGSRYLGFVFARAETPEQAEAALRAAHARLRFRIRE